MERFQPTVSAGDAYLFVRPHNHLFVVISDPRRNSSKVVMVNFTTYKLLEESCCIVEKDEHPFIKHKSCIRYAGAISPSVEAMTRLISADLAKKRESVSEALLCRIRKGACESEYLPEECRKILQSQGLI